MKHKSLKATILTAALALSMASMAMADPTEPGLKPETDHPGGEYYENKDTTVSIFTTSEDASQVSYTVPLYVTMAVSKGKADVGVPTNYAFSNTGTGKIGITGITFEKIKEGVEGNDFYTVKNDAAVEATDAKAISLMIAEEQMPAIDKNATGAALSKTIKPSGGKLTTENGSKVKAFNGGETLVMEIKGKVAPVDRGDVGAAAQFRVKYTVSPISGTGQALGSVYAGSDRHSAGLEDFAAPTPQPGA